MMWHRRVGKAVYVRDYGLLLRPRRVEVPHYQRKYDGPTEHLNDLLNSRSGEEAAAS